MSGINTFKHSVTRSSACLLGLCFVLTAGANAETSNSGNSLSDPSSETNKVLPQLEKFGKEGRGVIPATAQVTSVSQLSDVQPTDWAFTSLQSLVERYGCIAGYPDKTYRGARALSRHEFAAGLNACLDKVNELLSSGLADKVGKEDLATLQKLQSEFAAELATIKGRVGALEAKTETLEAQQFSTTTKLSGLAFFNLTGATAGDGVLDPSRGSTSKPNTTFSGLVWLNFNTSFTGKDLLVTQLAAGNGNSPINSYVDPGVAGINGSFTGFYNSTGTPFTDQTAGSTNGKAEFVLRELSYQFPLWGATVVVGPRVNFYKYFDDNRYTFFLNGTSSFNSISSTLLTNAKRGAGAIIQAPLGKQFDFKLGFLAESNEFLPNLAGFGSAPNPNRGLFGGNNALTAEVTYKPTKDVNLRFLYSRTNSDANGFGCVGGVGATPSLPGTSCNGILGNLTNGQANVFTFNFDWAVSKNLGFFGRYGISFTNLNAPAGSIGSVTTQAFQVGAAFPDLFKEGAQATISFVMPFNFTSGGNLLTSGGGGGTQYDLEASYYYPLSRNISVVPALYFIFNPNNFNSNPMITVANLRLQFGF